MLLLRRGGGGRRECTYCYSTQAELGLNSVEDFGTGGVRAFGLDCGFTASSLTGCANKIYFVKLFIAKDLQRLLSYPRHFCPRTKTSCGSGGNCRWTDQCSGTTKSGLCPGPDGFKCCLPTTSCKVHVISAGIKIPNQFSRRCDCENSAAHDKRLQRLKGQRVTQLQQETLRTTALKKVKRWGSGGHDGQLCAAAVVPHGTVRVPRSSDIAEQHFFSCRSVLLSFRNHKL